MDSRSRSPSDALESWLGPLGLAIVLYVATSLDELAGLLVPTAVYVPAVAVMPLFERLLVGLVFALLIGLWTGCAYVLTRHPRIGAPLRRYGRIALPVTFIAIGVWVFLEAGTHRLLM